MATHIVQYSVKHYQSDIWARERIPSSLRWRALIKGIKQLVLSGRVILEATYGEEYDLASGLLHGEYYFSTIYVGRKTIKQKGVRHQLRKTCQLASLQPIHIPKWEGMK